MERIDIAIIGSGPAGISASIYIKRANLSCAIFEKSIPGGKVNIATKIENYAGTVSMSGPELAFSLYNHAIKNGVSIKSEEVIDITKKDSLFVIKTNKSEYECYGVIIASGLTNKKLQLKNEDKFNGKGVSYCATCDGNFFKNKDVAVIGNDDITINEAIYLANLCSKVYFLINNLSIFDKEKISKYHNIELISDAKATEILGEESVETLSYVKDDKTFKINVSGIFPLGEEVTNLRFLLNLGVNLERNFISVDKEMNTNVTGVFAAGDVTNNPLKQIVSAASDGAIAATSAIKYVRRSKYEK